MINDPGILAPPPPAGPLTYAALFADDRNDPYSGHYEEVMRVFSSTLQPVTAVSVRELTYGLFSRAETEFQAYLCLTHQGGDNYIQVIHRPSTKRSPIGSAEPDERFAFVGDCRGVQLPQLVLWPAQAFSATPNVNVVNSVSIDTALAADPNLAMLGPFPDGQAGVTTITTRHLMYLPAKFVPLALGRVFSPRQAWDEIGGAIRAEPAQAQGHLAPLLNWLKASMTKVDATVVPTTNLAEPPRPPVVMTPKIQDYAAAVLQQDLPAANPGTPAAAPTGLAPLVSAVNLLTSEVVHTRNDEATRRANAANKTPRQYYGDALSVLLRLCHITEENQLPPLYQIVSNSNKRTLRVNLQQHFQQIARNRGLEQYAPLVTPGLATRLSNANFAHHDINNLEEGIQPFITPAWTAQQKEDVMTMVHTYDIIQEGASANLQDIMAMQNIAKTASPGTLLQTQHSGYSFLVLLHGILGEAHEHVLRYSEFMYQLVQAIPEFEPQAIHKPYFPMHMLRYVQIRCSTWFNRQLDQNGRVPVPDYGDMITRIRYQESNWEPMIPRRYLPHLPATPAPTPAPPAHKPAIMPTRMAPAPASPAEATRQRVNNPAHDKAYATFQSKNMPLAQVRAHARTANDPTPIDDKGTEICLCYHIYAYCWSNCSRLANHRPQSQAEKTKTLAWCKAHFV